MESFADTEKAKFMSKYHVDLIVAEENYLCGMGWKLVRRKGASSFWKHPRYTIEYNRNHALLIEKSQDRNLEISW
jgi:hypothetical protein